MIFQPELDVYILRRRIRKMASADEGEKAHSVMNNGSAAGAGRADKIKPTRCEGTNVI